MRITYIFLFFSFLSFAQEEKCSLKISDFDIYKVNANNIKCIAKNSDKKNTIFLTFARWCEPCLYHLPSFLSIKKNYDVDLYVLLVDKEGSNMVELAKKYITEDFPDAKILIIEDNEKFGSKKKYKNFLKEITPPKFKNIDDMSKYIVLNKNGEVELVTSYKDNAKDADWKDDRPMVRKLVLPLLEKKN